MYHVMAGRLWDPECISRGGLQEFKKHLLPMLEIYWPLQILVVLTVVMDERVS
jgi:hypothetical protein